MKTSEKLFTIDFAKKFKRSYSYKMGGSQIIVFPSGQRFSFNDKEYYSGRGSKYNSSIKHDIKGEILISKQELKSVLKQESERKKQIKDWEKQEKLKNQRILQAKKEGIYYINEKGFVELSNEESDRQFFDSQRLATTLKINVADAILLNSQGKTYVFAKSEDGNTYELYHSDLSCNPLTIWVSKATPERIAEFKPKEWQEAPYAYLVGQTLNNNHFVC